MQAGGAAPRSLHSVPTSPTTDTGLSTLQRLIRRMNCDLDLQATLDAVVQGVVDDLGFQVAVVNLVRPDGDLEVVAVAGSDEAIAQLHGQRGPRADWDTLLAVADPIGELRFVDHRSTAWRHDDAIPTWVPQVGESDDEDAWHADDALFAPLTSISDGLIGVLSVDLPVGGRRPGAEQLELLEMFAAQAQLAIENARLLAAVEAARKADTAVLLARLRAVFDAAPVAVVELDLQDRVHLWNPAAERLFGWTAAEVLGRPMRTVPATGADDHTVVMGRLASGEDVSPREVLRQRKDGSLVAVEVSKALLRNSQGAVTGVLAIMADVTERQALQHRLQARANQQAAVAELGQRALAGGDLSELFQTACAVVAQTLEVDVVTLHQRGPHGDRLLVRAGHGWPGHVVGNRSHSAEPDASPASYAAYTREPVVVEDLSTDRRFSAPVLRNRGILSSVCVLVGEGEQPWGVLAAHSLRPGRFADDDVHYVQNVANVLATAVDRRRVEDEVRHQALHDALTGLPNRSLLTDRLTMAMGSASRRGDVVGLLVLDLDGFKDVNDSLGHQAGDVILGLVASRLRGRIRSGDTAARLGGDEFALCLAGLTDVGNAVVVARELHALLETPFELYGMSVSLSASIGIATYPSGAGATGELLRQADVAMYRAKRERTGWAVYDPAVDEGRASRLAALADLRSAILEPTPSARLELHYQPLVGLQSGSVDEVEALVRWRHPVHGLVPPAEFITLSEQSGLIGPLTNWVLREAVRQVAAWRGGGVDLRVAVNISGLVLAAGGLVVEIADALRGCSLAPSCLRMEVTESALVAETARAALTALSVAGIESAIDDFGTGYSSLGYLKSLPASTLKVDRGFVTRMLEDPRDAIIVQSVVDLAHKLGMSVVAEGVETEAVAEALRRLGVDAAQGYLFSRPLPADEVLAWVAGYDRSRRALC